MEKERDLKEEYMPIENTELFRIIKNIYTIDPSFVRTIAIIVRQYIEEDFISKERALGEISAIENRLLTENSKTNSNMITMVLLNDIFKQLKSKYTN